MPHSSPKIDVRDALRGRTLLVTGTTGFLGKVFLEKCLRLCPDVKAVHLLVRSVDADHSRDRLEQDIFSSPIFDRLKEEDPAAFIELVREKIRFVSGDTSLPRLGMSAKNYLQLVKDVDLVVNSAASTEFMEPLDVAVKTNSLSVRGIVEFARAGRMRLLHVSTCYVNETLNGISEEKLGVLPPRAVSRLPAHPDGRADVGRILKTLESLVQSVKGGAEPSPELTERLVVAGYQFARANGWNNVYTFTKWLGEQILIDEAGDLQCTVVRPSIVESCIFEPRPGWIEGLKVADPLIYAFGTAMVHFFPGSERTVLDVMPVDLVGNAMFLAIAELHAVPSPRPRVYQSCSSVENPFTLGHMSKIVRRTFPKKYLLHRGLFPAPVFEFLMGVSALAGVAMLAAGKIFRSGKLAASANGLLRNLGKLRTFSGIYKPYTFAKTRYANAELLELYARASDADRLLFPVSARRIDWDRYIGDVHIPGLLKFVVGDRSPTTSALAPKAGAPARRSA